DSSIFRRVPHSPNDLNISMRAALTRFKKAGSKLLDRSGEHDNAKIVSEQNGNRLDGPHRRLGMPSPLLGDFLNKLVRLFRLIQDGNSTAKGRQQHQTM